MELIIGKTYTSTDNRTFTVTPIRHVTRDSALFVTEEFPATPFVVWTYHVLADRVIALASGHYFFTLEEALNYVRNGYNGLS